METVILWRPTGPQELALVEESGWRAWPPRLPDQPIFYPVLNEDYATRIARDWNVKASGVGYVTRFRVEKAYLDQFDVHQAGGSDDSGVLDSSRGARGVQPAHRWIDRVDSRVPVLISNALSVR